MLKKRSEEKKVRQVLKRNNKYILFKNFKTIIFKGFEQFNLNLIYTKPQGGAIV